MAGFGTGQPERNCHRPRRTNLGAGPPDAPSIARGLAAIDPEATEQVATAVCAEMRAEGALSAKDRHGFANVFIGKGKPWLLHLKVPEWKAPEHLIGCAIETCFAGQCPPFTQVALLGWLGQHGLFEKISAESMALIAKAIERWSPRWRKELRRDLPEPPPALAEMLAAESAEPERAEPAAESPAPSSGDTESAVERLVASARAERAAAPRERSEGGRNFDLGQALRGIESHVAGLRREIQEAKSAARSREGGRGKSRRVEAPVEASGDVEGLQRHNEQLEATITELRQHLEELASDHEDRAAALHAHDSDGRAQFAELLGLKLRESYAEFQQLRVNASDEVVRQHFGDMLETIFKILEQEGVKLGA